MRSLFPFSRRGHRNPQARRSDVLFSILTSATAWIAFAVAFIDLMSSMLSRLSDAVGQARVSETYISSVAAEDKQDLAVTLIEWCSALGVFVIPPLIIGGYFISSKVRRK